MFTVLHTMHHTIHVSYYFFILCNILIWSWVTLSFSLSLHHTQCNAWRVEIGGWDSCSITLQYLFSFFFFLLRFFPPSIRLHGLFFYCCYFDWIFDLKIYIYFVLFFFHADATYDISWSVTVLRIFINIIYERVCVCLVLVFSTSYFVF